MNPPDENALLLQAIALARSGHKEVAHALLNKIVIDNPHQEMAWLWLVQTETDPAQQVLILEECLRNNPKSEYAKKGLANLRAQLNPSPAPPAFKPPAAVDSNPRKPKKPSRGGSGIWKIIFAIMLLAVISTLGAGGLLLFPLVKDRLPAVHFPIFPHGTAAPKATVTFTPSLTILTATATMSATPTVTRTPTITDTPSPTFTPTVSPTPTLFLGTPTAGEFALFFLGARTCVAVSVPISGGPSLLTTQSPEDCTNAKVSPDGARIAFVSGQNQDVLQVVNIDGSNLKPLLKLSKGSGFNRSIWDWQWSPNGKTIALVAPGLAGAAPGFLYIVSTDSSGTLRQIKNGGIQNAVAGTIRWSPDSQWVFAWDMGLADQIPYPSVFRASDSRSVILSYLKDVPALAPSFHFDFSPDSKFVSYLSPNKPVTEALGTEVPFDQAYIIEAGLDKTLRYIALPMSEGEFDPSFGALWDPDGSGFLLLNNRTHQLVLVGSDGQIKNHVITLKGSASVVQWSPDGQWISIVQAQEAQDFGAVLEIVHPDGSDFRILADSASLQPIVWK
jgi:dipeptidyl aminopeptidase/acylaminoacyl peptidase